MFYLINFSDFVHRLYIPTSSAVLFDIYLISYHNIDIAEVMIKVKIQVSCLCALPTDGMDETSMIAVAVKNLISSVLATITLIHAMWLELTPLQEI